MRVLADLYEGLIDLTGAKDWEPWTAIFDVDLIDGTRSSGPVMRRRVPGRWEYRACTNDELNDHMWMWSIR
jgi:hypothetical protein